jgi:cell division protein FtsA
MIDDRGCLVGLDVGASKIAVVVGVCLAGGRFHVHGVGFADTPGVTTGTVIDSDALTDAIVPAVEEAEFTAGMRFTGVHLGLSGLHLLGVNGRGAITANRVIDWHDVQRAVSAAASAVPIPDGRAVLQVVPQDFIVDGQDGITRPEGLTIASPLEARAHVITCDAAYRKAIMDCVRRAGLSILSTRSSLVGAGEAVLTQNEKELGVAVIDIGVESTGIAIFERGLLLDTRTLNLGGPAFTATAGDGLDVTGPGAEEFCRHLYNAVPEATHLLNAGLVLTGGGSLLPGMADAAERVFDLSVRYGRPLLAGSLFAHVRGPHFAAAVGLALLAHRDDGWPSDAPRFSRPPDP